MGLPLPLGCLGGPNLSLLLSRRSWGSGPTLRPKEAEASKRNGSAIRPDQTRGAFFRGTPFCSLSLSLILHLSTSSKKNHLLYGILLKGETITEGASTSKSPAILKILLQGEKPQRGPRAKRKASKNKLRACVPPNSTSGCTGSCPPAQPSAPTWVTSPYPQ